MTGNRKAHPLVAPRVLLVGAHVVTFSLLQLLVMAALLIGTVLAWSSGVSGVAAMQAIMLPTVGRTFDQLEVLLSPQSADTSAYRAPYYDTQSFVSGTTTTLTFFAASNQDKSMSNAKQGAGFPANYYFVPMSLSLDFLADASLGANTELGVLDDINKLVLVNRGFLTLTVGSTKLPEIPISYLHASGGAVGNLAGSWTAPQQVQVGQNGIQDGGYFMWKSFALGNQLPFSAVITWPTTVTLASGNTNIRLSFDGDWYQPVA